LSKRWHNLLWLPVAAVLGWIGHGLLFTSFMLYDDEGYILLTLRNQIEHGGLYDRVYSQYGPFFYAAAGGLSRVLHFEWNNTTGRWFTLFNWLVTSGLCGLLVWRIRRYWVAALFTTVGVFSTLWIMLQEPGHPGGLITLLVAISALIGTECIRASSPIKFALLIGIIGSFVALTKINAGAFLLISAALWLLTTQAGRVQRPALAAALLVSATLPFVLMRPLLEKAWVPTFALLVALSAVSAVLACNQCNQPRTRPSHLLWFGGSALAGTLVIILWSLAQGTSLTGLLKGVVLAPLQHPGVYSFAMKWRPLVIPVALACFGLTATWVLRPGSTWVLHLIAVVRLLAVIAFGMAMLPWVGTSSAALALCYGVPLAAVFAIPLRKNEPGLTNHPRMWLALLLTLQSLQAFPIAGSQLNWGTFLWTPLMVLGLIDALDFWSALTRPIWSLITKTTLTATACILVVIQTRQLALISESRKSDGVPINLPGAETILLPAPVSSALYITAINARMSAGSLLSLPGAFSFNQWSARPTPTLRNVTHWFSLLDETGQQEIIDAMSADPRAAFILQRPLISYLSKNGFPVRGPLVSYLHNNYHEVLQVDAFSLWVHTGREVPSYLIVTRAPSAGTHRLAINLPPYTEPITRLEAACYDQSGLPAQPTVSDGPATSLNPVIQSLDEKGVLIGSATPVVWPLPPGGARRISFDFAIPADPTQERQWIFRIVTTDGRTLGFARFALNP
jgi:hypothetical protein